jgi:hypothetical protein
MAGRTGYTEFDNGLPPEGPDQMNGIYEHFDPLVGETAALISDLPPTGNWTGRTVYVVEVEALYVWDGSWVMVAGELAGVINAAAGTVTVKPASFVRKSGNNIVRGYAEIERTTANGGITSGTVFAVVGGGFRPPSGQTYTFTAVVIGTTSAIGIVQIASSGTMTFFAVGSLPSSPQSFTVQFHYPAAT